MSAKTKANETLRTATNGLTKKREGGSPGTDKVDEGETQQDGSINIEEGVVHSPSFATSIGIIQVGSIDSDITTDSYAFTRATYAEASSVFDRMCLPGGDEACMDFVNNFEETMLSNFGGMTATFDGMCAEVTTLSGLTGVRGLPKTYLREESRNAIDRIKPSAAEMCLEVANYAINGGMVSTSTQKPLAVPPKHFFNAEESTDLKAQTSKPPSIADSAVKAPDDKTKGSKTLITSPAHSSIKNETPKVEESKIEAAQEGPKDSVSLNGRTEWATNPRKYSDGSTKSVGSTKSKAKKGKTQTNKPSIISATTMATPKEEDISSGSAPSDDRSIKTNDTAITRGTIKSRAKSISAAVKDKFKGAAARANGGKKPMAPPSNQNATKTNQAKLILSGTTVPQEVKQEKVKTNQAKLILSGTTVPQEVKQEKVKTNQAKLISSGTTVPQEVKQEKVTERKPKRRGQTTSMAQPAPITMENAIVDDAEPPVYRPPCMTMRKRQQQSSWW